MTLAGRSALLQDRPSRLVNLASSIGAYGRFSATGLLSPDHPMRIVKSSCALFQHASQEVSSKNIVVVPAVGAALFFIP